MDAWVKRILFVVVAGAVFLSLQLASHWLAIILLLGIIFYALFANPMKEMHSSKKEKTKKRNPRKKKR